MNINVTKFLSSRFGLCALTIVAATVLAIPQAHAANIITFNNNATSCGGSVLCSTNGTTGYTGTEAFDLSTIDQWFQIDASGSTTNYLPGTQTTNNPNSSSGQFLVENNTGATVASFSLTIIDTFNSSTPSAGFCSGSSGPLCVNFAAGKGAASSGSAGETLSGPDLFGCTNPNGGVPCTSTGGQAAANFEPDMVTFTWSGLNIANNATFDITYSSFDNGVYAVPAPVIGRGLPVLLAVGGLLLVPSYWSAARSGVRSQRHDIFWVLDLVGRPLPRVAVEVA